MPRDRYREPRQPSVSEEQWHERAKSAILALLDARHACTISEMEAHCSDRANHGAGPWRPNPHHLTNARAELLDRGDIEYTDAPSRSHSGLIRTWSLPPTYGRKTKIDTAASRKRLLTTRHNGWSERGGRNLGLIGAAGEDAVAAALSSPNSTVLMPTGQAHRVLDVDLKQAGLGELDNTGTVIDQSDPATPKLVTVLVEVKNTREWIYPDNDGLLRFLHKAAVIQHTRPDQLILPVFVCRQAQVLTWRLGEEHGFLPAMVTQQLVLPDHELTAERFAEVRDELYPDLVLGGAPTNRHVGIAREGIAKRVDRAPLWRRHHTRYL